MRSSFVGGLLLSLTVVATSQDAVDTNDRRGFDPATTYQLDGIDSVNLFNGNLTLNVPVGIRDSRADDSIPRRRLPPPVGRAPGRGCMGPAAHPGHPARETKRRKRVDPETVAKWLELRDREGLTHDQLAERSGINAKKLTWWKRRLRDRGEAGFARVVVKSDGSAGGELTVQYRVRLRSGHAIEIGESFDLDVLTRVAAALDSCCASRRRPGFTYPGSPSIAASRTTACTRSSGTAFDVILALATCSCSSIAVAIA